ncbi:MAG TPA: M14 metallopeptidase family protein [Granulicella sp.]
MKRRIAGSGQIARALAAIALCACSVLANAQATAAAVTTKYPVLSKITTPKEALGFNLGDDYHMASYTQLEAYWKKLATESDRMKLVDMGPTAEGRHQYMAIITSPENMKKLDHYKEIARKLALAKGLTDDEAHDLAREGKAVVWLDGGLHATETVGSQQIMEQVYQMTSATDPEMMRILSDDITLCVLANPDGQELVSNWYMRNPDESKRSMDGLPSLFQHYIGHDNNRDFYMDNQKETTNMANVLFLQWYPQIMYNHHQTGPEGGVIFMPPFRDPFNYNFSSLIPVDLEAVGAALHGRLVAHGLGGSEMRSGADYSTWWNGGLRTIMYFHNSIGILTEIVGGPTPMKIPLVPEKQLPSGDWPLPIAPQEWHYRQSIEYEMSNNRAILDYASRQRETLLYNIYKMGRESIDKGSHDNWTITPKRIEALNEAAAKADPHAARPGTVAAGEAVSARASRTVPTELYDKVLHDPAHRDARGYIIPSDQADFPTAVKFINTLEKNGVTVLKASSSFQVAGKSYPAGSYIVKTDQAYRPHVLDMFEPQDHPNDFAYPGGPPKRPYDMTGYTLAFQMGVKFDRVLDGFGGPFVESPGLQTPPAGKVTGAANAAGWLVSHRINDSFTLINRLMKANCDVYWLDKDVTEQGQDLGTGTIWIPSSPAAQKILDASTKELGLNAYGVTSAPSGKAMKLKPIRIGLYDQYGGLMPSGQIRWLLEQFEFPFEVVYPQALDSGNLKGRFDVLVFTDGAARFGANNGRGGGGGLRQPAPETIPEKYRSWLGSITEDKTIPQIKQFVAAGGSVVTIGSSTSMAQMLGVPVSSYLTAVGKDEKPHPLGAEQFYIPGSLLKTHIDNTDPLAYGMPEMADVLYDNSPVFKLSPDAESQHVHSVAWYKGPEILHSGWAWGETYLDGGTAIVDSTVGNGRVMLLGPEVAFRAQPHGTFKFLFNGVYLGGATPSDLK